MTLPHGIRYNRVLVGRLRKKLDPNLIQTVRGLGYCLEVPDMARSEARAKA